VTELHFCSADSVRHSLHNETEKNALNDVASKIYQLNNRSEWARYAFYDLQLGNRADPILTTLTQKAWAVDKRIDNWT